MKDFSLPVLDIYFGRLFPDTDEAVLALELQLERVRTEAEQSWRAKDYILTILQFILRELSRQRNLLAKTVVVTNRFFPG